MHQMSLCSVCFAGILFGEGLLIVSAVASILPYCHIAQCAARNPGSARYLELPVALRFVHAPVQSS